MRAIILGSFIFSVVLSTNLQAKTFVFNIDAIDTVNLNGTSIVVEDLRDGYVAIAGIRVDDFNVQIDSNLEADIQFKNGLTFTDSMNSVRAVSSGGDMGGGGK